MDDLLTGAAIGAAIEVHRAMGPGLLEQVYQECLAEELRGRGLEVAEELHLPVVYKGRQLSQRYRVDLMVEGRLIIEVKATEGKAPVHEAQLRTYLKLSGVERGLLLNFNVTRMTSGIRRIHNPNTLHTH